MFRFFVFIILIYLLYKVIETVGKLKPAKNENYQFKSSDTEGEDLVEDPVCHTYVPLSQAVKKKYPVITITFAVNNVVKNMNQEKISKHNRRIYEVFY